MKPTCEELMDEVGFTQVFHEDDNSWRHGSRVTEVFLRDSDGTFWMAKYRLSTDGECNELREGLAMITQVEPYEVSVTRYRAFDSAKAKG